MISSTKKTQFNDINNRNEQHYLGNNLDRTTGMVAVSIDLTGYGPGDSKSTAISLPVNAIVKSLTIKAENITTSGTGHGTMNLVLKCGAVTISDELIDSSLFGIQGDDPSVWGLATSGGALGCPLGGELTLSIVNGPGSAQCDSGVVRYFIEYFINQDSETLV